MSLIPIDARVALPYCGDEETPSDEGFAEILVFLTKCLYWVCVYTDPGTIPACLPHLVCYSQNVNFGPQCRDERARVHSTSQCGVSTCEG